MMAQTSILGVGVVRIVRFWCILRDDLSLLIGCGFENKVKNRKFKGQT